MEAEGRIAEIWGERTPFAPEQPWPERVDQHLVVPEDEVERWVQSACVLCSNGCAVDIAVAGGRIVGVRGRAVDRINHGRLGPKGLFGWQANNSPDRLTQPLVRREGKLHPTDWDEAMAAVAERARRLLAEKGPLSLGFYTSGQLFLEDYYTQALVVRGGIGTPHLDGNTRLCTATASSALKESFGADGQPGSYEDLDSCDTLFLVGHNVAETQTVMWSRILDRLAGAERPRLVVVDPRRTVAAREADLHLPIKNGTNLALLNAIQHELIANGWIDQDWIAAHTVGFDKLKEVVAEHPVERAAEVCAVPADDIRRAARILGQAERLVSTCLQGVYQSNQATASAVQVNNINLLRGMIGKPGCAPFQLNGQPTAQNTRETGANGDLPAAHNWQNRAHVERLAEYWNLEPLQIPAWGPPTHAMQIFRYAEEGAIEFLWITGTNPAVSLPELHRIRSILEQERLFVVVSDAFLSETAQLADVVLPAAIWGEKTGTFTNLDRTVHLSEKAVDPPGEARTDMEMFLEFATRLDLRDKDGEPLIKWSTAEECFDAFRELSKGKPIDYSGLTYDRLRSGSGIQWPVTDAEPDGTQRMYTDGRFHTDGDETQDWGHDLETGASFQRLHHAELEANGKAILKAAHFRPGVEMPDDDYPLSLATGRTVYHFHTRTKTGRAPELDAAAAEPWVELAPADAESLGVTDGDLVRLTSPRGEVGAPARIGGVREGVVFIPFHYGYWDEQNGSEPNGRARAANELTITAWDPVSKQPLFKAGKVKVEKI
jgi:anaerobic selenocysteine-containing dehydrogenase